MYPREPAILLPRDSPTSLSLRFFDLPSRALLDSFLLGGRNVSTMILSLTQNFIRDWRSRELIRPLQQCRYRLCLFIVQMSRCLLELNTTADLS